MRSKKILYIGGWGRSGSTIISNVLGSLEGYVSIGEARYLWDRGIIQDRLCGCGENFSKCLFWRDVLREFRAAGPIIDPQKMVKAVGSGAIYKQILTIFTGRRQLLSGHVDAEIKQLVQMYEIIFDVTGADVLIDSSKSPPYAYALNHTAAFDLYYLHLVRDARAVAYSWKRRKKEDESISTTYFPRYSTVRSGLEWGFFNQLSDGFKDIFGRRYMFMRYEDFMAAPAEAVARVVDFVNQEPKTDLIWTAPDKVSIIVQHSLSGNPARFQTGMVTLEIDDSWKESMPFTSRKIIEFLCYSRLSNYGYLLGHANSALEA